MIFSVPAATPDTIPVDKPTVAVPVLLLVHVPPGVASASVVVELTQMLLTPVGTAGVVLTVTTTVAKQPPPNVYVIVGVPAATPVTIPEELPTVASARLLLVHVPPETALVNVVVNPTHTLVVPEKEPGEGLTVIGHVA